MKFPAACLAALAVCGSALAATDAERAQVYRQFREQFDQQQYARALTSAESLVQLTESQYGPEDRALVIPLSNLGTTQLRLGNLQAAETAYLRGLRILEIHSTPTDRMLIVPLQGLGTTYFAAGQFDDAAVTLKRAVDLSRNLDGLYNAGQLQMVESLIGAYVAADRLNDAEKEHQYAFRVAEAAYGKNDKRMLGPIDRYARWYEYVGRFTTARGLHVRALQIADAEAGRRSTLSVDALRGIARSYRLEFLNGAEEDETAVSSDPFANNQPPTDLTGVRRLNPDGERALKLALATLASVQPTDRARLGDTLAELGDWYLSGGSTSKGLDAYRSSWKELAAAGSTERYATPRLLVYKPSILSVTRARVTKPDEYEEKFVALRFSVTREGRVDAVELADSDATEAQQRAVMSAVRKARYVPRLENGEPVATPGVVLRERVLIRKQGARKS